MGSAGSRRLRVRKRSTRSSPLRRFLRRTGQRLRAIGIGGTFQRFSETHHHEAYDHQAADHHAVDHHQNGPSERQQGSHNHRQRTHSHQSRRSRRHQGRRSRRRWGPSYVVRRMILLPLMESLELLASLLVPIWRNPVISLPLGLGGLWLAWPLLAPALLPSLGLAGRGGPRIPPPEVISVLVEDPTRSIWALNLWKNKPNALLVMQGRPSSQIANVQYLRSQGLWPANTSRLIRLDPGCDTVGQVAALARFLQQQKRPGQLTMVTSNAHLPRTLAIARTVLGPMGWKVDGLPVVTQDNRPEDPLRLLRDQLRAQMLRFTGTTGSRSDVTCE